MRCLLSFLPSLLVTGPARARFCRAALNGGNKSEPDLDAADEEERLRVLQKQQELASRIASGEFTVSQSRYVFLACPARALE